MPRLKAAFIVALGIAAGAMTSAAKAESSSDGCPNTWCGPGDSKCYEVTNWECELSGGCAGAHKCAGEME